MDWIKFTWQYTGVAPFGEIYSWLEDRFGSQGWEYAGAETIYFSDDRVYTLFLLRWA